MSGDRYFPNVFEDYEEYVAESSFIYDKLLPKIECTAYKLLKTLELEAPIKTDSRDCSVYTGSTGIALLYMKLAEAQPPEKAARFTEKARQILETQRLAKRRHDFTFLCGDVGPIAVRAVLHHRLKLHREVKADVDLLHKFASGEPAETQEHALESLRFHEEASLSEWEGTFLLQTDLFSRLRFPGDRRTRRAPVRSRRLPVRSALHKCKHQS